MTSVRRPWCAANAFSAAFFLMELSAQATMIASVGSALQPVDAKCSNRSVCRVRVYGVITRRARSKTCNVARAKRSPWCEAASSPASRARGVALRGLCLGSSLVLALAGSCEGDAAPPRSPQPDPSGEDDFPDAGASTDPTPDVAEPLYLECGGSVGAPWSDKESPTFGPDGTCEGTDAENFDRIIAAYFTAFGSGLEEFSSCDTSLDCAVLSFGVGCGSTAADFSSYGTCGFIVNADVGCGFMAVATATWVPACAEPCFPRGFGSVVGCGTVHTACVEGRCTYAP